MAKLVNTTGEQSKTKIRSIRQDAMKLLKEDKKHQSADDIKKLEKSVRKGQCTLFMPYILFKIGSKHDR